MSANTKKRAPGRPRASMLVVSLATALASVAIFLALHPIAIEFFSERFLGGSRGDAGLYVWLVRSFIESPLTALRFETSAFYPYPITRAWSDSFFIPSAVVYALVTWCGVSLTAAYNVVLLAALGVNGAATYALARIVGVAQLYAIATGIVFANSSYFLGNLGHPQLLFFFWVPVALCAVLPKSLLQREYTRAPARAWLIAGGCVCGAFYSAVYYAIFTALALAVVWLGELIRGVSSPRRALRIILIALLGALPIAYALPAYLAVQGYFGTRGLYEAEAFAATGLSYLSYTPNHVVYGWAASLSHSEAYLGSGYILLAVAVASSALAAARRSLIGCALGVAGLILIVAVGSAVDSGTLSERAVCLGTWLVLLGALVTLRRERAALGIFGLIAIVFFVLSLGPGGNPIKGEPSFAPLTALYSGFPGISAVRAVGRFGIVVILGIILGAARGAYWIESWAFGVGRAYSTAVGALIFLVVGLGENLVLTVPIDAPELPPEAFVAYEKDSADRKGAAYLVMPFSGELNKRGEPSWSEYATTNSQYMLWGVSANTLHMVNGYSGQRPKLQSELPSALRGFPSPQAFNYIARICGVSSVLVVPSQVAGFDSDGVIRELDNFPGEVDSVRRFSDNSALLRLKPLYVAVHAGEATTLFGPRGAATRLEVSTESSSACEVTVSTLAKGRDGRVAPIHTETFRVTNNQEIRTLAPPSLSHASPHVIEVRSMGCDVKVGC